MGFLLAAVLFTLFGILLVRLTQVAHTDEMDRLLVPWNIPWLRAASGIVAAAFLFGVVVIMAAGSGALLEQMTGLPTWIGNALFMLAVAVEAMQAGLGSLAFREPWGAPFAPWQAFDLTGAVLADLFLAWALLRGDGGAPGPDYR